MSLHGRCAPPNGRVSGEVGVDHSPVHAISAHLRESDDAESPASAWSPDNGQRRVTLLRCCWHSRLLAARWAPQVARCVLTFVVSVDKTRVDNNEAAGQNPLLDSLAPICVLHCRRCGGRDTVVADQTRPLRHSAVPCRPASPAFARATTTALRHTPTTVPRM